MQINKYILLDAIGEGGMGRVFLAKDTRLNRKVALKVLSQSRLNDARAIVRFRREARLGAQLQHENLVRIYDEGEINGHCYLVMEYIEGASVGHLLAGHGPMPTSTASRLARQVALGLEHAREKGMIHRDVNPHNILVTRDGTAKLTDLGLAIEFGDANGLTLDGGLIGNYDYISPEQARHSRDVDSRSDIYSLGCTLYHMVAGRVPFPSFSLPAKIQAQLTSEPAPLSSLVPGVPKAFDEVVSRMMRKSPEERPPDPMAVARALEPFIQGEFFEGGFGASSNIDLPPNPRDSSRISTQVFPIVPPTLDGEDDTSLAGYHAFSLSSSSSSSETAGPAIPPPRGQPGGMTPTAPTQELGLGLNAPAGSTDGRSSETRPDPSLKASWLARVRALGPTKRIALVSLLAATVLISSILMAKPWRGKPPIDSISGSGVNREGTGEALSVAIVKADGTETPARDLKEALRSAGQGDLRIILRSRGRVRLEAEALEVLSGNVTIAADPAAPPILVVGLGGVDPFLRVKTRANLKLEGLTIQAEFGEGGGKVPALIEVKGILELKRCAFSTTDQAVASRAVSTEGPRLAASGCWFNGFKQCLDVAAFAGTEVVLDECMMIRTPGSDPWDSWAIRFRHEPASAIINSRSLLLRRCTITGACLLRADDFHPEAPLRVTVVETSVQAGALLAWKSDLERVEGCLDWSGRENLYDLSRASRVIRLGGPPVAIGGSADSDAWTRLMDERKCQDRQISFPAPASTDRNSPRPEDFPAQERDGGTVGADPEQVGPAPSPPASGR